MAQLTVEDVLAQFKDLEAQGHALDEQEQRMIDSAEALNRNLALVMSNKDLAMEDKKRLALGLIDFLKAAALSGIKKVQRANQRQEATQLLQNIPTSRMGMA